MSNLQAELLDRLGDYWQSSQTSPHPGATRNEILDFEGRTGVRLPPDMGSFYERFNGSDCSDENLIDFWPLQEIDAVPEKLGDHYRRFELDHFFVFADFMIWSHFYAIRLRRELARLGPVVLIRETGAVPVAQTFAEFIERYLGAPHSIL